MSLQQLAYAKFAELSVVSDDLDPNGNDIYHHIGAINCADIITESFSKFLKLNG